MVEVQPTPNPNAMKFNVGRPVAESGPQTWNEPPSPGSNPVVESIFEGGGVKSVFMVNDFVTVTREEGVEWDPIIERTRAALEARFGGTE